METRRSGDEVAQGRIGRVTQCHKQGGTGRKGCGQEDMWEWKYHAATMPLVHGTCGAASWKQRRQDHRISRSAVWPSVPQSMASRCLDVSHTTEGYKQRQAGFFEMFKGCRARFRSATSYWGQQSNNLQRSVTSWHYRIAGGMTSLNTQQHYFLGYMVYRCLLVGDALEPHYQKLSAISVSMAPSCLLDNKSTASCYQQRPGVLRLGQWQTDVSELAVAQCLEIGSEVCVTTCKLQKISYESCV